MPATFGTGNLQVGLEKPPVAQWLLLPLPPYLPSSTNFAPTFFPRRGVFLCFAFLLYLPETGGR